VFTSPQDDRLDKAAFLERIFPTADLLKSMEILKLVSVDDKSVFQLSEYELKTGERRRSVDFITLRGGQIIEDQFFLGGRITTA